MKLSPERAKEIASRLNYKDGLVTAVARDWKTKEVLMVAWMNEDAVVDTLVSGNVTYFSRKRMKIWRKGEESGNIQILKGVKVDCDEDSLLLDVEQIGNACHTGKKTCFYRSIEEL
jgi:phosphoribosyl-AMP cyclohydrolase